MRHRRGTSAAWDGVLAGQHRIKAGIGFLTVKRGAVAVWLGSLLAWNGQRFGACEAGQAPRGWAWMD
jgi:hypothetical protein